QICRRRAAESRHNDGVATRCGVDLVAFYRTLRQLTADDALAFVDVTVSQYWMAEVFTAKGARTFFNPTDNQSMGWSIPAALGAQKVRPDKPVAVVIGDGRFLLSGMEISTDAR